METLKHFTLIVVGNEPDLLIKKYDSTIETEAYIVYYLKDAKKLHKEFIEAYSKALSTNDNEILKERLQYLEEIDDMEFYAYLTDAYELDENGNAISTANPEGRYYTCRPGKNLSMPLMTLNGYEVFSALKKDVDWERVHLGSNETYGKVWDMVMGGVAPSNSIEESLYQNMKERKKYFEFFGDRETYIINSTAFWGYAFLSEKTGWVELEKNMSQIEWVKNFYDRFILPLDDNERISVYECTRIVDEYGE